MSALSVFRSKKLAGVLIGTLYGLVIRVTMGHHDLHPFLGTVSAAFLFVCPFSVGAIAVLWGAEPGEKMPIRRQLGLACGAMGLFLLGTFASFLEGLICIVLAVPVFMVASIFGGLVGGLIHNFGRQHPATLPVLAFLPFIVGPLENLQPTQSSEQSVTNTIHVAAPPDVVFDRLADVRDIQQDELGFTFVHQIGLPRPIEARMEGHGPGSVRTSYWQKQVWFQEVITVWDKPRALHYRFVVPKGAIPREALDEHVEINGEYFELVDGGFTLAPSADGGTDLSLTTRFRNKSRMKTYGDLWAKLVLKDFHRSILGLMKSRAERMRAPSTASTALLSVS